MKEKFNKFINYIKENIKKNKIVLLFFLVIWAVLIVLTLNSYKTNLGKESVGMGSLEGIENVTELTRDIKIKEVIPVVENSESIAIKFATYARPNKGNLFIKIIGEQSKKEYVNKTIDISTIEDNSYIVLELSELLKSNNDKNISIELNSDSVLDESIGIYYSSEGIFENAVLEIDEKEVDGDLAIRFIFENDTYYKFYNTVITWTIIGFSLLIVLILLLNDKYEFLFTSIVIILGLLFMVIITPMSPADEQTHYERTLVITNKILGKEKVQDINKAYVDYTYYTGHANVSKAYGRIMEKLNSPLELKDKTITMSTDLEDVYIAPYIPQTIGVLIGRILQVNYLKTFYAGRLINLLFYAACIYIAIKNTPVHKLLFGVIAITPMFIQTAASYSYDNFINGLCFLLISYLLKWYCLRKEISKKEFIFVFIVCLLVSPLKIVYNFIPFLFIFVPTVCFKTKKNKIISIIVLLLPGIYQILKITVPAFMDLIYKAKANKIREEAKLSNPNETVTSNNTNITTNNDISVSTKEEIIPKDENYGIGYITRYPLDTIKIFYRTIRFSVKRWFYESIGKALSGLSLVVPIRLIQLLALTLLASAFTMEEYHISWLFKGCSLLICIVIGMYILLGFFISWTERDQPTLIGIDGDMIQGVQGRYFSPLLPYVFILFNNKKLNIPKKINKYIIYIELLTIFEILVYVLSYTFVN